MTELSPLENTLIQLLGIDGVHPDTKEVTEYITRWLERVEVPYDIDAIGKIIATIPGQSPECVALVGHIDLVEPTGDRLVAWNDDVIPTDGSVILGGDDRTAVAVMLQLAQEIWYNGIVPPRTLQLIFTVGEEQGCLGSLGLDLSMVRATEAVVLDLDGPVSTMAAKAPGCQTVDIRLIGRPAHVAHPEDAEAFRSRIRDVVDELGHDFPKLQILLDFGREESPYELDQSGDLYRRFAAALKTVGAEPQLTRRIGLTDANALTSKGLRCLAVGAAYAENHGPNEYVGRRNFSDLYAVVWAFSTS
jgi:putative aminopeptidase FrvX